MNVSFVDVFGNGEVNTHATFTFVSNSEDSIQRLVDDIPSEQIGIAKSGTDAQGMSSTTYTLPLPVTLTEYMGEKGAQKAIECLERVAALAQVDLDALTAPQPAELVLGG